MKGAPLVEECLQERRGAREGCETRDPMAASHSEEFGPLEGDFNNYIITLSLKK